MENVHLKGISIPVSRLCAGGCPAGEYGWGNVDRNAIQGAILRAFELGVNFFDTADTYGLGRSEENMGEVLAPYRDRVVIASKFGVRVENGKTTYDNSPDYIEKALHTSLRHLKTDYIDLYQVHYLDGVTPAAEMMEALIRHKESGKIRAIGLSNIGADRIEEFLPYKEYIASFQNHYSLAHRDGESDICLISKALEAIPMTWGSLGQGILTGKYDASVSFDKNDRRSRAIYDNFYGDKLQKNLAIVEKMRPIAENHGVSVASVAVRFILDHLENSVVITGMKNPAQAESNAQALSFCLTPEETALLEEASR